MYFFHQTPSVYAWHMQLEPLFLVFVSVIGARTMAQVATNPSDNAIDAALAATPFQPDLRAAKV